MPRGGDRLKAGKLRHPITILAPNPTRDSRGQSIQSWTAILSTWGSVEQLRGQSLILAQAKTSTAIATHLITTRANTLITETCRVQFGATLYSITSILDPDSRGREMKLLCQVVKA